jgi:hypothetical protein
MLLSDGTIGELIAELGIEATADSIEDMRKRLAEASFSLGAMLPIPPERWPLPLPTNMRNISGRCFSAALPPKALTLKRGRAPRLSGVLRVHCR